MAGFRSECRRGDAPVEGLALALATEAEDAIEAEDAVALVDDPSVGVPVTVSVFALSVLVAPLAGVAPVVKVDSADRDGRVASDVALSPRMLLVAEPSTVGVLSDCATEVDATSPNSLVAVTPAAIEVGATPVLKFPWDPSGRV